MQDINLLQNKLKDNTHQWENRTRLVTAVLAIILVAELAAGGFFYMMDKASKDNKAKLDQDNVSLQNELGRMEDGLGDAKDFQAQSKNIATLLDSHVQWGTLMDELTSSVYKSSQIFSLTSDTTGQIHLEGQAADYANVGRMLLALETSDLFTSVQLMATSQSSSEQPGVAYSVDIYSDQGIFLNQN